MPKDKFDFEDPFELNGMALLSNTDPTNEMAECFIEEFMRMGYSHKQILAIFHNPQYLGPHMAFEKSGEPFIQDLIAHVFARWGKQVTWPSVTPGVTVSANGTSGLEISKIQTCCGYGSNCRSAAPAEQNIPLDNVPTDPMGTPIPKLNL